MLKKLTLVLATIFISFPSMGALTFSPSITYLQHDQETNNVSTDAKLTMIDLRFGYIMDMGLYFGGLYSIQDYDLLSESSDAYFGPSIGYYNSGFFIVGTFYLYGEKDLTDGSGKFTQVSGYQIDISYSVPVTSTISIGPQLTYHAFEFDEIEVDGFAQPSEYSFSGITPYFNVTFMF